MALYFFDLIEDGDTIIDPEGLLAASLDEARHKAILIVRDVMAGHVARGALPLHHALAICDSDHRIIERFKFADAFQMVRHAANDLT